MSVRMLTLAAGLTSVAALVAAGSPAAAQAASLSRWRVAAVVGPALAQTELTRVAATGASNAWAAGATCVSPCQSARLVVARASRNSWRRVTLPRSLPAIGYQTVSIGTSSPRNVWVFAARAQGNSTAPQGTVAVHWDGARWTQPRLPSWFFPAGGAGSFGEGFLKVAAFGPRRVWVFDAFAPAAHPVAAFYNGTSWSRRPLPLNPLAVSALSATDMWVAGESGLSAPGGKLTERALHWNGRSWQAIRMPQPSLPGGRRFVPFAAVAQGARSSWVQGTIILRNGGFGRNELLRWNGRRWSRIAMPLKGVNVLGDMTADGRGGIWLATLSSSLASTLGHYASGRWTIQAPPRHAEAPTVILDLTRVPRTRSDLAAGTTGSPIPVRDGIALGVIARHA